ncbi:MAG: AsmA family protein [Sideroxydans sp.]|nr:AsmA family protein [Sideroxydans sp.]
MNKFLKYALYLVGGLVVIFAAALTYIALTFDPNTYKPQIIQAVKDSKQRTLKLDGDIKLFFFPNIGASLGKVSLSEFKSEKEFAAIGEARVSLAFMPLLSTQVVVNEVILKGVKANVIKHKDGTTNLDDLLTQSAEPATPKEPSAPIKFDVAAVHIDDAEFGYSDEASGAKYNVKELSLHTGRIANGMPSKIDFAVRILANQPKVDITAQLKTTLTFDLEKNVYQAQGLDVQVKGAALGITDLLVKLGVDVQANVGEQVYATKKLMFSASGLKGSDKFDAKLDVPALSIVKNDITVEGIALNAQLDAAFGNVVAALSLPSVKGDMEKFKLNDLTLNVDVKQPEQAFKVKLSSPVTANLKTQQYGLTDLLIAVNATGDKLPGKSVSSELKGNVQADLKAQNVQVNLAGGLLQSQIKAKFGVTNFAAPAIRYDLEVDQFDADLYIPKSDGTKKEKSTEPEQPFDLSALKPLNIDGSLRVGALKAANVKVNQLRVDVKAKDGVVKVAPFSANLYGGSILSDISVDANKAQPAFAVNAKLSAIEIGPLLKDALDMDFVNGKGSVGINVTTQGNMVSLLKKALNGSLSVNLADGAVKGINLAKSVREVGKSNTQGANATEKTDFSELKATFKITNGVAHNEDLSMKSPFVRVGGKGDINVGNDSLDYLVKATVAGTAEGQGGKDSVGGLTVPVRISGAFTDLKFKLDFGSMVSDEAKQKVAAAADAAKQQANAAADAAKLKAAAEADAAKAKAAAEMEAAKLKAQQEIDAQKAAAKAKAEAELKKGLGGLFK